MLAAMAGGSRGALLAALLALVVVAAAAAENVVTLDAANFDDEIGKHDFTVVEFYAPWCGHCKSLAPEYEKAATSLKEEGSNVVLAKVDADNEQNKPLAQRFGVQGFPTLKIFRKDAGVSDYNGPRDAKGIASYVKKQSGPASTELMSAEVAADFFKANPVAIVGVFPDYECKEYASFIKLASELRADNVFAHTLDAGFLPEQATPVPVPGVRIIKDFDEKYNDLTNFELEPLKTFVETKTLPNVVEMNKDPATRAVLTKMFTSSKPKALLIFDYNDGANKLALEEAYNKVAAAKEVDIHYVIGDATENKHALDFFGVKMEDGAFLVLHDQANDKKYMKTDIKAEDIPTFINDYKLGNLVASVKSEPIPESNDGPVKVVVTKQFEELVTGSGKNVLIEFYAPWCGHCKKLAPVFDKVGESFADDDEVTVAKMDATANDVPDKSFNVKGFPTIYFVNSKGDVELYEGGRTKKDFVKFVNQHRTDVSANTSVEEVAEAVEATLDKVGDVVQETVTVSKDEL